MAFPAVAARNTSRTNIADTNHTVSLPSGISSGDLLIIVFAHTVSASTVTFPAGYTKFATATNNNADDQMVTVAYRQADGTEGASITVTTGTSGRSTHVTLRITGHENPATQAPEAATSTGDNLPSDPPNLTPTGGAKDYLWLAVGANSNSTPLSAAPTNYSDFTVITTGGSGGGACTSATGERQLNAASENPGAFTGAAATSEYAAITIAVHPASVAGRTTKNTDPHPLGVFAGVSRRVANTP